MTREPNRNKNYKRKQIGRISCVMNYYIIIARASLLTYVLQFCLVLKFLSRGDISFLLTRVFKAVLNLNIINCGNSVHA